MTSGIRIRPRFWLAPDKTGARWNWAPLSLIFRKQRLPQRPITGAPASLVSFFRAVSFLSGNNHFHTHESKQILRRSVHHLHFSIARYAAKHPASAKELRRPEATVLSVSMRERSIEKHLRSRILHERQESFTSARHLREFTTQAAEVHGPGARTIEPMIASPAQRLLMPPRLFRSRIGGPASPQAEGHREPRRIIRGNTLDVVVGERVTPRLRRMALPSTPPSSVTFRPRSVEQVWRQPPQQPSRESSREKHPLTTASQTTTAEAPVHTRVGASPAAPTTVPVFAPTKLEGPALERLADDIRKRIERHLRIERERRGI
jgi:hypothetical protein